MKKHTLFMFIVVLFLSAVLSSCSQPEAKTPESAAGNSGEIDMAPAETGGEVNTVTPIVEGSPQGENLQEKGFCRGDWDACGFEPWAEERDFNERLDTQAWHYSEGMNSSREFNCWQNKTDFTGGSIYIRCYWGQGSENRKLYRDVQWHINVTDAQAEVKLPRGLNIGSTIKETEHAFDLGEADALGIYYRDIKDTRGAVIQDLGGGIKEMVLAAPAGETDSEWFTYTCSLSLVFKNEAIMQYKYMSIKYYRILPGLPSAKDIDEMRVFRLREDEPERVMKPVEATDLLACIQKAGRVSMVKDIMLSHRIEIESGGEVYTIQYGEGLFISDGKIYRVLKDDGDALLKSVPELKM